MNKIKEKEVLAFLGACAIMFFADIVLILLLIIYYSGPHLVEYFKIDFINIQNLNNLLIDAITFCFLLLSLFISVMAFYLNKIIKAVN